MTVQPADPEKVERFRKLNEKADAEAARRSRLFKVGTAVIALLAIGGVALREFAPPPVAEVGSYLDVAAAIAAVLGLSALVGC